MDYKQSLSHNGPCEKTGLSSSCLHNGAPYWQITKNKNDHFLNQFTNHTVMQIHFNMNEWLLLFSGWHKPDSNLHWPH